MKGSVRVGSSKFSQLLLNRFLGGGSKPSGLRQVIGAFGSSSKHHNPKQRLLPVPLMIPKAPKMGLGKGRQLAIERHQGSVPNTQPSMVALGGI